MLDFSFSAAPIDYELFGKNSCVFSNYAAQKAVSHLAELKFSLWWTKLNQTRITFKWAEEEIGSLEIKLERGWEAFWKCNGLLWEELSSLSLEELK